MTFVTALVVFNVFWLPFSLGTSLWMFIANFRTHEDRMNIITAMMNRPQTGEQLMAAYKKVSYSQHMRARFLFRDPWKLYDPCTIDSIKNPRTEIPGWLQMLQDGTLEPVEPARHTVN